MNPIYYKLYINSNGLVTIVCLQDFDECDYVQSRFLCRQHSGDQYKFDTEEEAKECLNNDVRPELIDPQYRIINQTNYYRN